MQKQDTASVSTTYITPVAAAKTLELSALEISKQAKAGVLRSIESDGRLLVAQEDLERLYLGTAAPRTEGVDSEDSPRRRPLVECEPWCWGGDGHPDAIGVRDQWCNSEPVRVYLTREKLVSFGEEGFGLDDLRVTASREFEGRPYVNLARGDNPGVDLTSAEAIELGEALIRVGRMTQGSTDNSTGV